MSTITLHDPCPTLVSQLEHPGRDTVRVSGVHGTTALMHRSQPRFRLTRRGWLVLTALVAVPLVLWVFVLILGAGGPAVGSASLGSSSAVGAVSEADASGTSLRYTTIGYGDTLWGIAEHIAPKSDPREVIDKIMHLNGLDSVMVQPGQRIALPPNP